MSCQRLEMCSAQDSLVGTDQGKLTQLLQFPLLNTEALAAPCLGVQIKVQAKDMSLAILCPVLPTVNI